MAIKDVILGYAKGDKGDRGPQGEKGATGATGPKGEPGNIADAQITDTEGLDVAKGQKTTAQKLFDAIANRIVTKLVTNDALTKKLADYMLKGMMSNTNVNNTGTVPTSALMYSMFEQINSDLAVSFYDIPQPADNDIFTFDTWEFRCLRSGNIVTLKINIGGNMKAISDFIDLLTLDSKYKPFNYNIIHNYVTQQGKPMILNILANGTVRLWNMNTSISDGWICRQCITYVTNS